MLRLERDGERVSYNGNGIGGRHDRKYAWLGEGAFVGTLGMAPASEGPAVLIRFYRVK